MLWGIILVLYLKWIITVWRSIEAWWIELRNYTTGLGHWRNCWQEPLWQLMLHKHYIWPLVREKICSSVHNSQITKAQDSNEGYFSPQVDFQRQNYWNRQGCEYKICEYIDRPIEKTDWTNYKNAVALRYWIYLHCKIPGNIYWEALKYSIVYWGSVWYQSNWHSLRR
jgi:hypothetical protein